MTTFSTSDLGANAVPLHPSLLTEDEAMKGVSAAKRYFAMGYEHHCKGGLLEAIHNYRRAVALCPTMFEAYFNMALCYEKSKDGRHAIQAFEQVARLQQEFTPIYRHLSYLYSLTGDHERAQFYERLYRKLHS